MNEKCCMILLNCGETIPVFNSLHSMKLKQAMLISLFLTVSVFQSAHSNDNILQTLHPDFGDEQKEHFTFNIDRLHEQLKPAPSFGETMHHPLPVLKASEDQPLGDMGAPVLIENPTEDQKLLIARGYERNEFNEYVSDLIPLNRNLPDYRNDWCKRPGLYLPTPDLLPTSIIMCFYNEALSVLLRSIHSILDRTPPELLTEIILVDDFSEFEELGETLEKYVTTLKKIRIVRASKREGLIRARMLGASVAHGPILTFLDSHIEVTEGWFEPMSDRITKNLTTVVCPVIDAIDDDTLEYHLTERSITVVGGFTWDLMFGWTIASDSVLSQLKTPADPIPSPTMAGGLFSIHKHFFEKIGQYDEEYEIWGAENLELSFKSWMCGGSLEIQPCSHVGHIYRKKSPYAHKSSNELSLVRNLARLAAVWLDEYAFYYFAKIGVPSDQFDYGDIAPRLALRKQLKCKNFEWYLNNIYPDGFNPKNAVAEGEVRNEAFGAVLCLDAQSGEEGEGQPVAIWPCHGHGGNQFWFYTPTGEMMRDDLCLDYAGDEHLVMLICHKLEGNQHWMYDNENGFITHVPSQLCLTMDSREILSMQICEERITQRWKFSTYNDANAMG